MAKPKVLELTEAERLALEKGFRLSEKHCFRMRCRAVLTQLCPFNLVFIAVSAV